MDRLTISGTTAAKWALLSYKGKQREIFARVLQRKSALNPYESLRDLVARFLLGGEEFPALLGEALSLKSPQHRRFVVQGLVRLVNWQRSARGDFLPGSLGLFRGPNGLLEVKTLSDFILSTPEGDMHCSMWNTKTPLMDEGHGVAMAVMHVSSNTPLCSLLNLRSQRMYRPWHPSPHLDSWFRSQVKDIETLIAQAFVAKAARDRKAQQGGQGPRPPAP